LLHSKFKCMHDLLVRSLSLTLLLWKERNVFLPLLYGCTVVLTGYMYIFMQVQWWRQHSVCQLGQPALRTAIHHAAPASVSAKLTSHLGAAPKCIPTYLNPQAARKWTKVHYMWANFAWYQSLESFITLVLSSLFSCCIFIKSEGCYGTFRM